MSMSWLQSKTYTCVGCSATLLHDQMHGHWAAQCPRRPKPPQRPVLIEKVYRPEPGR